MQIQHHLRQHPQKFIWINIVQTFLVVGHQVRTHLRRDFVPLLFADPLQVIKVSKLMVGNSKLQLRPQIFCGIKVWRPVRPLQDLNVLLLDPLLCCLGCVFWAIVNAGVKYQVSVLILFDEDDEKYSSTNLFSVTKTRRWRAKTNIWW